MEKNYSSSRLDLSPYQSSEAATNSGGKMDPTAAGISTGGQFLADYMKMLAERRRQQREAMDTQAQREIGAVQGQSVQTQGALQQLMQAYSRALT